MLNSKWLLSGTLCLVACSGKAELGGEAVPGKQPNSAASPPAAHIPPASLSRRHLLLVVEVEPAAQRATTLDTHWVDLPLPTHRVPVSGAWRVEVLAADGSTLFAAALPDAALVRGEFHAKGGQIEGVSTRKPKAALSLRLPVLPEAAVVRLVDSSAAGASAAPELGRVPYPKAEP